MAISKKILVVSTSFPMSPGDGLSPFIWEFCLHLHRRGWEVTALVPHHKGLKDQETWGGITVRRFRYLPERYEDVGYTGGIMPNIKRRPWKILKLPLYIYSMYRESLRIAVEEKSDLVNFHWLFPVSFWLSQFARSSGLPVVLTGHGTDIHLATKSVFKVFANSAMKKAAALTLNSSYMKDLLRNNTVPSRVEIIPMGVDIDRFRAGGTRPSQSKTILYVGRLIKQKGIDLLVEAFIDVRKQVPDARMEIIGYGPEKDSLQRILHASKVTESVTMTDVVPHADRPAVYGRSRVLVLPALIGEGLGMTPAEAGACGVPAITFSLGGTPELVLHEKTGLVIAPGRDSLAEALRRLLTDDRLADNLGANARQRIVELLSWESISAKFDRVFSEIVEGRK